MFDKRAESWSGSAALALSGSPRSFCRVNTGRSRLPTVADGNLRSSAPGHAKGPALRLGVTHGKPGRTFLHVLFVLIVISIIASDYAEREISERIDTDVRDRLHNMLDGEVTVRGVVIENVRRVHVDGHGILRIRPYGENVRVVNVIYFYGEFPPCQNDQATTQGLEVRVGEEVEVFGKPTGDAQISTCDASEYYIKRLSGRQSYSQ